MLNKSFPWITLGCVVATMPVRAETVPLAELVTDARIEISAQEASLEWSDLGHRAAGWAVEPESGRAWGLGLESRVELKRLPDHADLFLTGKPFIHRGSRVQEVDVLIADEPIGQLRMTPWRRTYRLRIPARALTEGSAMLTLRYRWSASPDLVLQHSDDRRILAVQWSSIVVRATAESTPTSLEVEGDVVVLRGTERARLPLRTTLPVSVRGQSIAVRGTHGLDLRIDATGVGSIKESWEAGVTRPFSLPADADNPDQAGPHRRLTLQASRRGWLRRLLAFGRPPEVRLHNVVVEADELSWPSRDLARLGHFPAPSGPTNKPDVIILWVVDTLRADHLGLYGYSRDTSDHLDSFAVDAVTFDRAVAQSAWTRPSVTSILTGQLLKRHGVYGKDDALAREATTLAEVLARDGYETGAFITNGNLRHVGLEQGFGTFRHFKEGRIREFHYPAQRVRAEAVDWLDRRAGTPTFLYLHVSDPHLPYIPTPEFADHWPVEDPSVGTIEGYRATIRSGEPATQDLIDLYDAEIRQADAAFGALLEELRDRGLYEGALIVFTADHGEEFLDHGAWQHGNSLYAEQISVPLVIRWPDGSSPYPPDSRLGVVAAHADLAPTILRTVGLAPPTSMQGHDLAETTSRPTFAELRAAYRATVDDRYKLITDPDGTLRGLYDVVSDPNDQVDLTLARPAVLEYHRRLQALFLERSSGGYDAATAEQDAETIEQLRALGYLD